MARVTVRQVGHTDVSHSTDWAWKVRRQEYSNWYKPLLDDRSLAEARSLGEFGRTARPGGRKSRGGGATAGRFKIDPAFHVEPGRPRRRPAR